MLKKHIMLFDTETTGLPKKYNAPVSDVENYPRMVQLGMIVLDPTEGNKVVYKIEYIVRPDGFAIPVEASNIHKITTELALEKGVDIGVVLADFLYWMDSCHTVVGHNIGFDIGVLGAEVWRSYKRDPFVGVPAYCTMMSSIKLCQLPGKFAGSFKFPKLAELYKVLFGHDMGAAHTALQDIENTAMCYFELSKRGLMKPLTR